MRGLVGVLCDIDDTLTLHGRLVPAAFQAMADLQAAGLHVVPVTGRPAGWVDHLARMWPVDGVVGENGGLWSWFDGTKLQRRYAQDAATRASNRARLDALAAHILSTVPGCALASDQAFRDLDLAVDYCEDVPTLGDGDVLRIVQAFHDAGATCKVSSIHVNGWFGDFDKLTGCQRFLAERFGASADQLPSSWLYIGDSANDEPMFRAFPLSVGVANVARFLPQMTAHPRFITRGSGGDGFAEMVARVLSLR